MADPDQRHPPRLKYPMQPVPARGTQCRQRKRAVVTAWSHRAELEPEPCGNGFLERDALGGRTLDEHVYQPGSHRLADQAIDLDPRYAQSAGYLLLGMLAHVGEPCRAGREAELVGLQTGA